MEYLLIDQSGRKEQRLLYLDWSIGLSRYLHFLIHLDNVENVKRNDICTPLAVFFFSMANVYKRKNTQLSRMMDMDMDAPKKLFVAREKNFVKRNIFRVKRSYPAEPKQRFVDTRYGNTHDLKSSGLLPIYVHKKNYGKIPKFIAVDTKADVSVETETIKQHDFDEDKMSKISSCRYIDKEERRILLDGMKKKWEETMRQFQKLPFLSDTLPKAQKKAKMERELQQLEKDIATIEQHPHIYVYDNNA
ncbi:enkurin [Formica exsecta]|uniref:enkurin n=1 Tax=Formica exsecta TaxID=72781 RepID=UPI0011445C66|nr:enkurin [Formica exsecta]